MKARLGTDLHNFAHEAIRLGIKLPETETTLNLYVNDAIGYKMDCEVALFYSPNCFGHADTASFRTNMLRIHDLKTGVSPSSHHQLEVYAALFCLEYEVSPFDIDIELRIYQHDTALIFLPTAELILELMEKIIAFDQQIEVLKEGGSW